MSVQELITRESDTRQRVGADGATDTDDVLVPTGVPELYDRADGDDDSSDTGRGRARSRIRPSRADDRFTYERQPHCDRGGPPRFLPTRRVVRAVS